MASSLGIGLLARHGCLVRDPAALEALARTRLVAFDKTGTLTSGNTRIIAIDSPGLDANEVLARVAGLERHSEHGLGRALMREAAARGLAPAVTQDMRVVAGRGIMGNADGKTIAAGNAELMRELGWKLAPELATRAKAHEVSGHSRVYVGWGGVVRAVLALEDTPLPEARATIDALRQRGLDAMLLTGDLPAAARRFASLVGIDETEASLSPEQKRAALDLRRRAGLVAMVGDGLNDGPVLATADVGIAVGSATDLARETAALVLPPGGLWLLPYAVDVARAVRRTILGNLAWAFGYNFVAVGLATAGLLQPVLAAAVMAGSSLLVVLNSLRLERLPDPSAEGLRENAPTDLERAITAPGMIAVPAAR
jgi:Cu2+-exporting ATPase